MYDENGEAFGFNYNGNDYYYVRNAQNDVIFISNSDNTGVVMYQYDAWGNMTACYDTSDDGMLSIINPYTYRGYFYEFETNTYFLKSRYYNPELCRFISADGIVNANQDILGNNLYAYCSNNPVNNCDETGCGKISNWIKSIGQKVKNWLNSVPNSSVTVPSSNAVINRIADSTLGGAIHTLSKYKVKKHVVFGKSKKYNRNTSRIKIAPDGDISKPYAKVASTTSAVTSVIACGALGLDIANTWTENNSNTNGDRLIKTGVQLGCAGASVLVGYVAKKASTAVLAASGGNVVVGGIAGTTTYTAIAFGGTYLIDYAGNEILEKAGIE